MTYHYAGPLMTTATSPVGTVTYGYDNNFRVTSENVSGSSISFGYDADGLLTTAGAMALQNDPNNALPLSSTLLNSSDVWTYDSFGAPASYVAGAGGSVLFSEQFTRNDVGQIVQRAEAIGSESHTYAYGYDASGRLTSVQKDGVARTYTLDDNGNRLSDGMNAGTYDAQDRLLSYGGATYKYQPSGELATKVDSFGTTTYTYDELGNLMSVALPTGGSVSYTIDAANRRIGRDGGAIGTRRWIYSGPLRIAAEIDGSGTLISRFVYATHTNVPDYMVRAGTTYRIITDHLGSVRLVVDAGTGAIAQRMDYDEFGRILVDTNPGFQPFGFSGGLYDPDTQLVRFGERDYDPKLARWTVRDPILFGGRDANMYEYSFADPVNLTDSTGRDVWLEGPSGNEPTGHLSINVGDPTGDYASFSFGIDGHGIEGQVYRDTSLGGDILDEWYRKTTPEEDARVFNMLQSLVGNTSNYTPWRTCRNFSIDNFKRLARMGIGRPAAPRSRIPFGSAKSWSVPSSLKPSATDALNPTSSSTARSTRP